MRLPRIFIQQDLAEHQLLELPADLVTYLIKALRLQQGHPLILFNGQGGEYNATLATVEKRKVTVEVHDFQQGTPPSPLNIHIGQTLSRGERMDYAIQKSAELGANEITPLFSEHCEVKLKNDRINKRVEHWQKISHSACEQCGNNIPTKVHNPQPLTDWINNVNAELKIILHHQNPASFADIKSPTSIALLIGPEGGLSEDEISLAQDKGFKTLKMGPRILRTETAPVVALALLQSWWGDL